MITHRAKVQAGIMARNCLHESVVALDADMSGYHRQAGKQEQYCVAKCKPMSGPLANLKPSNPSGTKSLIRLADKKKGIFGTS